MDCDNFRQQLGGWLDGKADGRTRASLQAHCLLCPDCRRLREARQSLRRIMEASNADEQVPSFIARILQDASKARNR